MNTKKIETLIGFAIKSRKIVFGEDFIKKSKNTSLVLVDKNSSEKYKERIKRFAKGTQVVELDNLESLTHRENVHSLAILDSNLANGIKQEIENI